MTEVFISYSRRDKEFVRRLHEALLAQKRDVWVDWEDIPPTADWRAEIRGGIDATNAMIFVISPDSARSKECRVELELALENNKRLIPLMYRMVTEPADQQAMHPSLNSHNWIMLRDEDPFEEGFQTVLKALDTDLAHVREHTRLLVRAREWDAEKRDSSLLLRGTDLIEAEKWLAGALAAKPAPTQLHSDYIRASREAEIARSRRLLIGVMAALLVSLLLSVFAFAQWQQSAANLELANVRGTEVAQQAATSDANALLAQNNAATAVYNEARSESIALAAQVQLDVDNDNPERGVLLAMEALQQYPYTAQAESALGLAVQNTTPSSVIPGTTTYQGDVFWSPDNRWLAAITQDEGLTIWSSDTIQNVATLSGAIIHVAWSPDATRIATSDTDTNLVTIWDTNWQSQFQVQGTGAVWSPDGSRLVTRAANIMLWDGQTGQEIYSLSEAWDFSLFYNPIAWSPDGTRLAAGSIDGSITIWNAADGTTLRNWQAHEDVINIVSWSPDGTQLVSGSGALDAKVADDASAKVWDAETGDLINELSSYDGGVISAAWSPDGNWIFSGTMDYVDVFDTDTWDASFFLNAFDPQWSAGGEYILFGNLSNNQITIYDTGGNQTLALSGHKAGVVSVAWSPDNVQLASASLDGTVRVWNVTTERTLLRLTDDYYYQPVWSADGDSLWTTNISDDTIYLWDVETGANLLVGPDYTVSVAPGDNLRFIQYDSDDTNYELSVVNAENEVETVFKGHQSRIFGAEWSPDGREIASGSEDNVMFIWNADTGEERLQLKGYDARWSPDGKRLIVIDDEAGAGNEVITIRDALTGDEQFKLPVEMNNFGETFVTRVAWSPDGTRIATSSEQGIGAGNMIEIWDASDGKRLFTLLGTRFSWSPDGERIASAQLDGTVAVQTLTGEMVYSIDDPIENLSDVVWSPNGRYLATTDRHDNVAVWRAWQTTADMIDYADQCCITRDLTDEERAQFGLAASDGS